MASKAKPAGMARLLKAKPAGIARFLKATRKGWLLFAWISRGLFQPATHGHERRRVSWGESGSAYKTALPACGIKAQKFHGGLSTT